MNDANEILLSLTNTVSAAADAAFRAAGLGGYAATQGWTFAGGDAAALVDSAGQVWVALTLAGRTTVQACTGVAQALRWAGETRRVRVAWN